MAKSIINDNMQLFGPILSLIALFSTCEGIAFTPVCDRTYEVKESIEIAYHKNCEVLTATFLKSNPIDTLSLIETSVHSLKKNDFEGIHFKSKHSELIVANNPQLTYIQSGAFKGIRNINRILISDNPLLGKIGSNSFEDLTFNFENFDSNSLSIERNGSLTEIETDAIMPLGYLHRVNIKSNPKLTTLQPDFIHSVPHNDEDFMQITELQHSVMKLINISDNKSLQVIAPETFGEGIAYLTKLTIESNSSLVGISARSFNGATIQKIEIGNGGSLNFVEPYAFAGLNLIGGQSSASLVLSLIAYYNCNDKVCAKPLNTNLGSNTFSGLKCSIRNGRGCIIEIIGVKNIEPRLFEGASGVRGITLRLGSINNIPKDTFQGLELLPFRSTSARFWTFITLDLQSLSSIEPGAFAGIEGGGIGELRIEATPNLPLLSKGVLPKTTISKLDLERATFHLETGAMDGVKVSNLILNEATLASQPNSMSDLRLESLWIRAPGRTSLSDILPENVFGRLGLKSIFFLNLARNDISTIKKDSFTPARLGLERPIVRLSLRANPLDNIEDGAFNEVERVEFH